MAIIRDINKLRLGLKIMQDGEPCVIINNEFVNPGKGQSFSRIKFRKLISGKILEKTFKSGDSIKLANVKELNFIYLYHDSIYWYFMNLKSFDQIFVSFEVVKDNLKWLIEQSLYTIIFWDNNPIFIIPPHFVELQVVNIQVAVKGDSASPSTKLAVLSTGLVVKVPLFIQQGNFIRIDTRSSEYVSRIK